MNRLVLFDVDKTLVYGIRTHKESFRYAFKKVYGIDTTIDVIEYEGMTDQQIIIETLKKSGLKEPLIKSRLKECMNVMIDYYRKNVEGEKIVVLKGVRELLEELKEKGVPMSLVTGSLREIAMTKLKKAGLDGYFKVGGFGDDDIDRANLIRVAIKRAKEKFNFSPSYVFLFGDTPKDIKAGKEVGIKTIGVATGAYDKDKLFDAGADFVFDDLKNTEKVLRVIFSD